jgi:hypothetical protein
MERKKTAGAIVIQKNAGPSFFGSYENIIIVMKSTILLGGVRLISALKEPKQMMLKRLLLSLLLFPF